MGKVIHLELRIRLKSDHSIKSCMQKTKCVRENETYKIVWDFKLQTDHRTPDLLIINKKTELVIQKMLSLQWTMWN